MAKPKNRLPQEIDRYLAALSKFYAQEGKRSLQELIVNATVRVHEEWESGTDFGESWTQHALYLMLPDAVFLRIVKQKDKLREQIKTDLNNLHNVRGESIGPVFLEMDAPAGQTDWRSESGLLATKRDVPKSAVKRLWPEGSFRVFMSHKTEVKKKVADLKERLARFGVASFVAHEDIQPTREWREEIENALASMDVFVALLTDKFHESDWTDQEVGYALARGVPMVAVKLGRDPYGFIGKFQALTSTWDNAHKALIPLLMKNDRMVSAYIGALRECGSFDEGNELAIALPAIENLSESQADEMVAAYNDNSQLSGSFGFNGTRPTLYGKGLVFYLNKLSDRTFKFGADWTIEQEVPF